MSKSNAFVVMTNGYCEKSYRYGCLLDRMSMVKYSRVDLVLMRRSFCIPLQKLWSLYSNSNPSQGLN